MVLWIHVCDWNESLFRCEILATDTRISTDLIRADL
jgi:hypothetical protein